MVADKKEEREIPLTEYAAGSYQSILKYPDVKVINEGQERVLPFQEICISIKMESRRKLRSIRENRTYAAYYRFNSGNANKQSYVLIKNVGFYNGSWIDLRINVLDISSGYIDIYKPTSKRSAGDF